MTRIAFLVTIVMIWAPSGLIHMGQRMANPDAQSIVTAATIGTACSPTHWGACR